MGYCERCGGKFDFEGICEICGDDDEWSWGSPKNNQNKVQCKNCGAMIYEARRYCHCCGAKNEAAFKEGKSYCPECGIAFEDGACPECGKDAIDFWLRDMELEEIRYCAVCGERISYKDKFCMHCRNENYRNKPLKTKPAKPSGAENKTPRPAAKIPESYKYSEPQKTCGNDINTTLWLILGIVSTVICCMPTGIGTIIYSIQASNCVRSGMFERAKRKLRTAKIWFFIGIGIIAVLMLAAMVIQFLSAFDF